MDSDEERAWAQSGPSSDIGANWRNNDDVPKSDGYGSSMHRRRYEDEPLIKRGFYGETRRDRTPPLSLPVPADLVGKVIGRGGAKIRQLEEESGARIKVIRDDYGDNSTVLITGESRQQKKAKELIKALLDEDSRQRTSFFSQPISDQGSSVRASEEAVSIDWGAVIRNSAEAAKKKWAALAPIEKNFYIENPEISLMLPSDVAAYRASHNNIMVSHFSNEDKRPIPNPVLQFDQAFEHYPELLDAVKSQKFTTPSPIQSQAWPILLKGHDMIGIAQTGTGKTLAFLLPAMVHIQGQTVPRNQREGPTVLVMAPTRELAQQIECEVKKYPFKGIQCVCVYGGGNRREQMAAVAKGVEIAVATPGRLYDLMQAGALKTSSVSYVVLDEADRMLDLGFEPQIKKILLDIRPDRQMVMTSATWPEGVRRIANDYMDSPMQVYVGTLDLAAVHSVTQFVEVMAIEDKSRRLMEFIENLRPKDKVIVFVGRKLTADQIASELSLNNIVCQCIHGDREQMDREQALAELRSGEVRLLVATDVASRGIDIKDITHILNYDFPRNIEEYVHRVGRTGRAGATGVAISFVTREDWAKAGELIDILQEAKQEVPRKLVEMSERYADWKARKDEERQRNAVDMGRPMGGARGSGCFKCGEEGHFSRDCPSGGGGFGAGARSGGRACFKGGVGGGGSGGGSRRRRDDFGSGFF